LQWGQNKIIKRTLCSAPEVELRGAYFYKVLERMSSIVAQLVVRKFEDACVDVLFKFHKMDWKYDFFQNERATWLVFWWCENGS